MSYRLLLLEDHALVRDGLERSLLAAFPGSSVVYSGPSLSDARAAAADTAVDCAIVDLDLGDGRSPAEVVSAMTLMGIPVVVVSALGEPAAIQAAVLAGASAYVMKRSDVTELVDAVRATVSGEGFMSVDFARSLIPQGTSPVELSDQQEKALVLYASGLKLDAVARRMGIAPSTAKEHLKRVREKYAAAGQVASTKMDLHRLARDSGLLP